MESKYQAQKALRTYRILYSISLVCMFAAIGAYSAYALMYKPEQQLVLLNHVDSVYRNEDLTKTNSSEGETKQLVFDILSKTFTYDYLSFVTDETYEKFVTGELYTDLPDHRDAIRPLFNDVSHQNTVNSLKQAPWMFRFTEERRRIIFLMTIPPSTRGIDMSLNSQEGRLSRQYNGYFFVISTGYNRKEVRYRIDYNITIERRPNSIKQESKGYFFRPLVSDNNTEWRVSTLTWEAGRVT